MNQLEDHCGTVVGDAHHMGHVAVAVASMRERDET